MLLTAGMVAASCSDYSDYNSDPLDQSQSANKTLWENISSNSNLSDFAALLTKAGMAQDLQQPTFYTVWAPLNGTYDAASLMLQDSATLRNHFIMNHIAYYNHTMSGTVSERVKVLNEKSYNIEGFGSYTFAGVQMSQINQPSVNGVLHILNGEAQYYPNIYEYISQLEGTDSLVNYFKHYEHTYLDEENSVLGPVVNGMQTYIDSVMVTDNDLFHDLSRAYVDREDSSYTMIIPSNEAWAEAYAKIKPYYKYINNTIYQTMENATVSSYPTATKTIDAAYYTDSIVKRQIAKTLVYNNNSRYNLWLENGGENTDTLMSTAGVALTNPDEFIAGTTVKETMSNGFARHMESLAYRSWDVYAPERRSLDVGKVFNATSSQVRVTNVDQTMVNLEPGVSTVTYRLIEPTSRFVKPTVVMMLNNALSTSYNIYCVLVPEAINLDEEVTTKAKPNRLNFSVSYCNANGTIRATQNLQQNVTNDASKVDTVYCGKITFPTCYYGLGSDVAPNLKIQSNVNGFSTADMNKYDTSIRIAAIILRPTEYDTYLGNKH